jgi:hypothetical protein
MVCPGVQVIRWPAGSGVNGPVALMNENPTTVVVAMSMSFDVQRTSLAVANPLTQLLTKPFAVTASLPIQAPLPFAGTVKSKLGVDAGASPGFGATVELSLHAAYNPRMPTTANMRKKLRFILGVPPYDW